MALINSYIHFNGNAEEAFTFYRSVFGGAFAKVARYKDISSPELSVAENDANRIMHITLPIGKSNVLMAGDILESTGQVTENDNRNTIANTPESREEAGKLFNGLSAGGKIEMPIADGPLGSYFGMFADKFGVQWTVDFTADSNGKNQLRKTRNR